MAIVVGGEALVDLVPHAAGELRAHPGGGPYNTARTLGRLEQDVHYLGCLSDDGFGGACGPSWRPTGSGSTPRSQTRLPTTLALAELDDSGAATYRFYTDGTSAPALTPEAGAGGAPGRRRLPARRHARARDGADRGGAAGGRRGGGRQRADHGRPELPADLHRGSRLLPPRPGRDAALRPRGQGERGRPRVPDAGRRAGRGRAGAARRRAAGRPRDARRRRRADRHRHRTRRRSRRRRSRSSTRSAPATPSAAASSPTGASTSGR